MRMNKVLAAVVVAMMVISGLAIVSTTVVSNQDALNETDSANVPRVNAAQRCVLMEDFTSWTCGPCAGMNPYVSAAIDNLGYSKVAPTFYHVWWPAPDSDPVYQYNKVEVTNKTTYYACNAAPWFLLDGTYFASYPGDQAEAEAMINARATAPANMTITTQGDLSGTTGNITIRITAVENIPTTDLRLFVNLWENNITRALWDYTIPGWDSPPYPNGETELDWAVWDMVPTEAGTKIWPTGASAGATLEYTFPLTLNSSWTQSEVGATVFVQSAGTKMVEQAAVETFDNFPPIVSITNPPSATAEQILSGTIPITWTATDTEDVASTLDIYIDYSPDGGATWVNIMSGTNNNIAPYTYNWNTIAAGIPDGTGYVIRARAIDSHGDTGKAISQEAFSVDNVINDRWFFQLEVTGANKDLDMRPVEMSPNFAGTGSITTGGQFIVGTWDTTQTFTGKGINGPWTFNIYGKTPNPSTNPLVGYLYAKVFTSSNTGTPLATTGLDNENVGAFLTTHLFTWTETLSGTIVNGDAIVVEIWLSVSGGPYGSLNSNLQNMEFNASATPWTFSNWVSSTTMLGTSSGTYVASGGNPGGYVRITLTPPTSGSTSDLGICSGYWQQSFNTGMIPYEATLTFDWTCTGISTDLAYTYAYIFIDTASGAPTIGTQIWRGKVDNTFAWSTLGPIDVKEKLSANTTYYIKMCFRTRLARGMTPSILGYDNVKLNWSVPSPVFYEGYDYGITPSNVVPTLTTTSTWNPWINISVVSGWNLISVPYVGPTTLPAALQDMANGGAGLVVWDRVQTYSPATPTDLWKRYYTGWAPALNDLTAADNTMGVWIYVTTVGDGLLCIGGTGYSNATSTVTPIRNGWNLVGFPSDDAAYPVSQLKIDTGATVVEGWSATPPYYTATLTDPTNLAMGKAYWIYVPSPIGNWTKAW